MIKTLSISLLTIILTSLAALGDEYKITHIDKEGIRIGKTFRYEGDCFDDKEPIHWTSKVRSFRAKNLATSKLKRFSADQKGSTNSKSPGEYYTKLTGLTSRDPFTLKKLGEWLNDTFVLESTICIPTEERVDSDHYFVLIQTCVDGDKVYRLPITPGQLRIDRSIFSPEETDQITVAVEYVNLTKNTSLRLTDKMNIIFWDEPQKLTPTRQEE